MLFCLADTSIQIGTSKWVWLRAEAADECACVHQTQMHKSKELARGWRKPLVEPIWSPKGQSHCLIISHTAWCQDFWWRPLWKKAESPWPISIAQKKNKYTVGLGVHMTHCSLIRPAKYSERTHPWLDVQFHIWANAIWCSVLIEKTEYNIKFHSYTPMPSPLNSTPATHTNIQMHKFTHTL